VSLGQASIRSPRKRSVAAVLVCASLLGASLAGVVAPAVSAASSSFGTSPVIAIPNNAYNGTLGSMASDTINASSIPAARFVTDITVDVGITHTWVGDLTIKLQSPSGTILALAERPKGDGTTNPLGDTGSDALLGDNSELNLSFPLSFNDAYTFDPENMGLGIGDTDVVCVDDARCLFFPNPDQAVATGSVVNFADFYGEVAGGNWTLFVGDGAPSDTGTFVSWSITITHTIGDRRFFFQSPGIAIPEDTYDGTMSTMATDVINTSSLPAGLVVTDIKVQVVVAHTWVGDLTIKLRSPSGTILALIERPQGDGSANNTGEDGTDSPLGDSSNLAITTAVNFNDEYTTDPEDMGVGIDTFQNVCEHDGRCLFFPNPDQALETGSVANFAAFDGETVSGNWTLGIGDSDALDVGTFSQWSLTITYALPLVACSTPPFSDVPVTHPFCVEIKWMGASGISNGFGDGTYRPSIPVTRQAMSAFMARLADVPLPSCTSPPFTDVPTDHPFCPEIKWMKDALISTGFGDGTYRPEIPVTRQAMSAFMARLGTGTLAACTTAPFSDVPITHPFCSEIKWMKDADISTGFGDGTYRPSIDVTRQAMSAFMERVRSHLP
jgi:subtilisin-like proprotein convertase family protein